jgi:hypothetical protein
MHSRRRRNFVGSFSAERLGDSLWRLAQVQPATIDVYLRGVEPRAAQLLATAHRLHEVGIEWHDGRVLLTFSLNGHIESLAAAAMFAHEPVPTVLRALPLAEYDARQRRFWQRVFWVVRLPGGRRVLEWMARRAR